MAHEKNPPSIRELAHRSVLKDRAAADAEDTAAMLAQEREGDAPPDPPPDDYPCPEIVWQGPWKTVSDIVGIRDWRVWIAVTASMSARAHRNIHVNYFGPLYGMGYWLLVAPTGTGKSLVTSLVEALMPDDYRQRNSCESGQALVEMTGDPLLDEKGKILCWSPVPCLLNMNEWTSMVQSMSITNSSLSERLCEIADGRRKVDINRTINSKAGGAISVPNPTLTIVATTTTESHRKYVKQHMIDSGFVNRHFHLPGPHIKFLYDTEAEDLDFESVRAFTRYFNVGHTFGNGVRMRNVYCEDAFEADHAFGTAQFENIDDTDDSSLIRRLHVYNRRIAMLYAWASESSQILLPHVQAANAAVLTSLNYVKSLFSAKEPALTPFMQAHSDIEAAILAKIRDKPGVTAKELCMTLKNRFGGYSIVSERITRLLNAGAIRCNLVENGANPKKSLFLN